MLGKKQRSKRRRGRRCECREVSQALESACTHKLLISVHCGSSNAKLYHPSLAQQSHNVRPLRARTTRAEACSSKTPPVTALATAGRRVGASSRETMSENPNNNAESTRYGRVSPSLLSSGNIEKLDTKPSTRAVTGSYDVSMHTGSYEERQV